MKIHMLISSSLHDIYDHYSMKYLTSTYLLISVIFGAVDSVSLRA